MTWCEERKGLRSYILEIDRFYEEVTTSGAEIIEGIVKRGYGSREFIIRDCNGYKILIGD